MKLFKDFYNQLDNEAKLLLIAIRDFTLLFGTLFISLLLIAYFIVL
jgi:hypothetical protein